MVHCFVHQNDNRFLCDKVGNDLDDTTGTSITCGTTYYEKDNFDTESRAKDCTATYPFVSIAAEMERAFRDLGAEIAFCQSHIYTENDRFTKTGSGQT